MSYGDIDKITLKFRNNKERTYDIDDFIEAVDGEELDEDSIVKSFALESDFDTVDSICKDFRNVRISEIVELLDELENLDSDNDDVLAAYIDYNRDPKDIGDLISAISEAENYELYPDVTDEKELGEWYMRNYIEADDYNIPDIIKWNIDYEGVGNDLKYDFILTNYGLLVEK